MESLREQMLFFITTPIYVGVIALEAFWSNYRPIGKYAWPNTLTNLCFMLLNGGLDLLLRGVYLLVLGWCFQFRLIDWSYGWWYWVILLVAEDFCYYWLHRLDHHCRFFWAVHVTHHSSEHYNLTVGFRSSIFQPLYRVVFFMPLPLLGFQPLDVLFIYAATQIWGILVHTEHIGKLPAWVEFWFVTPSHHRVHHASNTRYLDRNLGMFLIIWDRLFGTFQAELPPTVYEPIRYGLTTPLERPHFCTLIFHEWHEIGQDLRRAPTWRDRWQYIFGPPGWSHDGSKQTSQQLRALEQDHSPTQRRAR